MYAQRNEDISSYMMTAKAALIANKKLYNSTIKFGYKITSLLRLLSFTIECSELVNM